MLLSKSTYGLEPAVITNETLIIPTARVSPVSWLPAAVYVAQSVRPDATPHVPAEQSAQVPATRRVASVKRSFVVVSWNSN